MKKYLSVFAALALLFACTEETVDPNGGKEIPGGDKTVHVTGVSIDRTSVTVKEGESVTLVATVKPDNADNKTISWSSSDAAVASVDNGGKVTGVKAGSATVTAKTEDGEKTASCVVTVEPNLAPSVTVGADNISAISAVLKGKANLTSSASSDLKVGFQYSKSAGILPSNSTTVDAEDADANYNYSTGITGLEPGTTYYFRSFVRQNGQDEYGETKEFKTNEVSSVIQTQDAAAISAVSAKLNASFDLKDMRYTSKSFGFYWGTSAESLGSKVTATEGNGAFSADLSALNPSKQYYFQAFASFDGKELKEAVKSFTTKDIGTILETRDASGIEASTATLNAKLDLTDVKYSSIDYGFYWSTSESSQNLYLKGGNIADHAYTAAMSNLSHKTQYWYKAYVKLDNQTFYGEVKTFTTDVVKVESVSLDRNEYTFNVIENYIYLHATILPADATDKSIEWTSSNEDVATVDQSGRVTAKDNGTATITATTKDQGKTASCAVTVAQLITGLSLDKYSLSLNEGEEYTLSPTITPSNAANTALTWTSSDESVATVNQAGKVTAVSKGTATIKAETQDGSERYASCSVTVIRLVSSIVFDKTSFVLYTGQTETIMATVSPADANDTGITWTSSNTSIASVSSSGVVTGKAPGNVTITAKANDASGKEVKCEVEVRQSVTGITLDQPSLDFLPGDSGTLIATVSPSNAYNKVLDWSLDNSSVATVEDGLVKALVKGKATITVSAKDGSGITAKCSIVVSNPCPEGAVDLGLKTAEGYRLYWAKSNLSTNGLCANPEDYGNHYAWGEIEPKSEYNWTSYKWWYNNGVTKYCQDFSEDCWDGNGSPDNKTVIAPEDDAAHVKLGENWRIPTYTEWMDLTTSCTWTWTTENGVSGSSVTGANGNKIFLPAAGLPSDSGSGLIYEGKEGDYWSSSLTPYGAFRAYYLYLSFSTKVHQAFSYGVDFDLRYHGYSIRPVIE